MPKTAEEYLKSPYARILIPQEDHTYFAEILEFPGCFAQGTTPQEAFGNLEEAAKAWIESALDQGQEIPPPSTNEGFSGRLILRLPRSLHRRATRMAERDRTSLNQFLMAAIAERLGAESLFNRMIEGLRTTNIFVSAAVQIASAATPEIGPGKPTDEFKFPFEVPTVTASTSVLQQTRTQKHNLVGAKHGRS
jgi:antitoxin HicB